MSRGPVDKQQLAAQIIQSAKAAGIEHFVLDFDGTVLANHFYYNEEYGKKFYDQDPASAKVLQYKTKLKEGITEEQAQGIFADFELFDAILNEAFRNEVKIHIASKQSYSAIASVLERAGIREELITGRIHGNPHINGLASESSPSDPRGNGGDKIRYIASLVEQGIGSSSIFYADDAELFGEKAKAAGLQDVTTFGCTNTEEMLPLTQHVVASRLEAGMIEGDRIVGAGLDQSKWEMINAKFVEKVKVKVSEVSEELTDAIKQQQDLVKRMEEAKKELEGTTTQRNDLVERNGTAETNLKNSKSGVGGFFRRIGERIGVKTNISKFEKEIAELQPKISDLNKSVASAQGVIDGLQQQIATLDESVVGKIEKLFELAKIVNPNDQSAQFLFVKDKLGEELSQSLPEAAKQFMDKQQPVYAQVNRNASAASRAAARAAAAQEAEALVADATPVVVVENPYDSIEEEESFMGGSEPLYQNSPVMPVAPAIAREAEPIFGIVPTVAQRNATEEAQRQAAEEEAAQMRAAQSLVTAGRQVTGPVVMPEEVYENVPSKAAQEASERALQSLIEGTKSKPVVLQPLYMNLPGAVQDESVADEGYQSRESLAEKSLNEQLKEMIGNKFIINEKSYILSPLREDGTQTEIFTFNLGDGKKLDVVFSHKGEEAPEFLGVRQRGANETRGGFADKIIPADLPGCARLLGDALTAQSPGTAVASAGAIAVGGVRGIEGRS